MSIGMGIEREHKDLADVKYQIKKTRGAGKKSFISNSKPRIDTKEMPDYVCQVHRNRLISEAVC